MFSYAIIKDLIQKSDQPFRELSKIYTRLPGSRCLRRCHCCALLPEMTFVEALSAFRLLIGFDPGMRKKVFKRVVGYFFSNAMEINACPFLEDQRCLIYPDRFFGCRAYGLWSKQYYQKRVSFNRKAKKELQKQWQNRGISLPKAVIDFRLPYCRNVIPEEGALVDDAVLGRLNDSVERLSAQVSPWHQIFCRAYYSDLSFLSTSLIFGAVNSAKMKFAVVRDTLSTGNRQHLNEILDNLPETNELN